MDLIYTDAICGRLWNIAVKPPRAAGLALDGEVSSWSSWWARGWRCSKSRLISRQHCLFKGILCKRRGIEKVVLPPNMKKAFGKRTQLQKVFKAGRATASVVGVGDPTGSLPPDTVFCPGVDATRVVVTRSPCVRRRKGRGVWLLWGSCLRYVVVRLFWYVGSLSW